MKELLLKMWLKAKEMPSRVEYFWNYLSPVYKLPVFYGTAILMNELVSYVLKRATGSNLLEIDYTQITPIFIMNEIALIVDQIRKYNPTLEKSRDAITDEMMGRG